MKRKTIFSLDKNDERAIELFKHLGMTTNMAKTLMYLSQVEECRSADIEQGADLRQPEVSIAMKELIHRGWVSKRFQKKDGKGRPFHIYKTVTNLPEIFSSIEQDKLREVETVERGLTELKGIVGNSM
jgi:predicted transcriptional regulator